MSYRKYFKNEQKLILRPVQDDEMAERVENLTVFLHEARQESCDLRLPYGSRPGEEYPFTEGMSVELSGEALGLGVRITGHFDRYFGDEIVRISLEPTLEVFQRRNHPRHEVRIGLRYTRGHGTLRTFRRQWDKNVHILAGSDHLQKLGSFPTCHVNLSEGGVRFAIRPPVEVADLCMILLELQQQAPPVCALAEVVWTSESAEKGALEVGMRFINILKSDQKRIAEFLACAPRHDASLAEAQGD